MIKLVIVLQLILIMTSTLIQMALLIGCGVIWRINRPAGLGAEQTRLVLTTVVYYLLLPALIIHVMRHATLGQQSLQFAILGVACILFGVAISWAYGRIFKFNNPRMGAVILAASFPNVTYLGLPVLRQTYGEWAESVAIQMDLFSGSPLLFTVGIFIARHFGQESRESNRSIIHYLNTPPFWAAAIAILLNLNNVQLPDWLTGFLQLLGDAVIPLMLFSLGMALNWQAVSMRNLPYVFPVILIKMVLMPILAISMMVWLTLEGEVKAAAILEMAMPSMVLGVVFCDRYRLDTSLYAMAVTLTTVLSLITLPFLYEFLG